MSDLTLYRIDLQQVSTKQTSIMTTRAGSEDEARRYAQAAIGRTATPDDLRITAITHFAEATLGGTGTFTASAEVIRAGKATKLTEAMRSANNKIHLFRQD